MPIGVFDIFWIIMTYCETQTRTVRNSVIWAAYDTDTRRPTSKYNSNIQKPISALKKLVTLSRSFWILNLDWVLGILGINGYTWPFLGLIHQVGIRVGFGRRPLVLSPVCVEQCWKTCISIAVSALLPRSIGFQSRLTLRDTIARLTQLVSE